jgi:hypothetical protein
VEARAKTHHLQHIKARLNTHLTQEVTQAARDPINRLMQGL